MLELIGRLYSGNEWLDKLGDERQKKVLQEHKDLRQRNEEIDLLYCTQFCDKRTIIKKSDEALKAIGFKSAKDFSKNLKDIEELRNEIAHSCKVSKARWETVSELCKKIESLIDNIENFLSSKIQAKRALKREI
jgi:chloramphenicol O-acetyltransferase